MKGHYSILIPTKRYIRAYLISRFGQVPVIERGNNIGNKFYDLLEHRTNESRTDYSNDAFNVNIKIFVSNRVFKNRGCNLNESNLIAFNKYMELEIKERFYFMMDVYVGILPSFEANLPTVRKKLGISEDEWETDSMKKAYYRYRKESGKPTLYRKLSSQKRKGNEPAENTSF